MKRRLTPHEFMARRAAKESETAQGSTIDPDPLPTDPPDPIANPGPSQAPLVPASDNPNETVFVPARPPAPAPDRRKVVATAPYKPKSTAEQLRDSDHDDAKEFAAEFPEAYRLLEWRAAYLSADPVLDEEMRVAMDLDALLRAKKRALLTKATPSAFASIERILERAKAEGRQLSPEEHRSVLELHDLAKKQDELEEQRLASQPGLSEADRYARAIALMSRVRRCEDLRREGFLPLLLSQSFSDLH